MMLANGLLMIARVKPGREEHLRQTLNRIGNDIRGRRMTIGAPRPHIDFPRSRTLHFARVALLDDPDTGLGRKRMLLVTDYSGTWDAHVQELHALTSDPDAIWGCCEGYTGCDGFADFVRSHMIKPQAYYIALPELGLEQIRRLIQTRVQLDRLMFDPPGFSLMGKVMRVGADLARFPLVAMDVLGIMREHGPLNTLLAARSVNATLDRIWYIWLFNRLTLNGLAPPSHRHSEAPVDTAIACAPTAAADEVVQAEAWDGTPPEDLVSQNQLTLVTAVRPEQVKRLQAVLAVIDLYGRRLAEPGALVGISTIHTVRWALIDGDSRLLLASNYDGPWENYIDEFAELILSGLDAIWRSSYGYPEAGAQDVEALKHFLRCHQAPANVFYSAYPNATLLNLVDALEMERRGVLEPQPAPRDVPMPATS